MSPQPIWQTGDPQEDELYHQRAGVITQLGRAVLLDRTRPPWGHTFADIGRRAAAAYGIVIPVDPMEEFAAGPPVPGPCATCGSPPGLCSRLCPGPR